MMLRRRAMYSDLELPDMYQKLAFLQSNGNQYLSIDDYIPQIGDSLSTSFVRMYNNWGIIFSAGTSNFQVVAMLGDYSGKQSIFMKYFTSGEASRKDNAGKREKPYNLRFFSDGKILFDGTEIDSEVKKQKSAVNTNLYLFIRVNLTNAFAGKILGFQAERSGETILNLVPALRSSDGKPGMLDTVSKKFYVNQGTGEFLYELA